MDFYQAIAPFYDQFNADVDHASWADFAERCFKIDFKGRVESILDLGTGTGSLAIEFAKRGYDMIGVDNSEHMLSVARNRAEKENVSQRILWLCQDMTSFELYGTVDAVVSSLDCMNHLLSFKELTQCFGLVHNYLNPNGLFLFDVNSPYKFHEIYGDKAYILENENALCAWQNDFDPKKGICDFYISLFTEGKDGRYDRIDTVESEKMYSLSTLKRALTMTGFEFIDVHGESDGSLPEEDSERLYILARAIKKEA